MADTHEIDLGQGFQRIDATTPQGQTLLRQAQEAGVPVRSLSGAERRAAAEAAEVDAYRRQVDQLPPGVAPAVAATVGAADSATLGAVSALDPNQAANQALREEESGAYTGGRVAGAVLPALLPGMAPAAGGAQGLAAIAGNVVSRRVLNRLARAGVSQFTQRVASGAAGAAVDGLVGGLVDTVTESNIQGTPIEGEQLLSNGLFGAGLGLGIGGLMGATSGSFARATTQRARQQLDTLVENGLAREMGEELALGVDRSADNFWDEVVARAQQLPPESQSRWADALSRSLPTEEAQRSFRIVWEAGAAAFDQPGWARAVENQTQRYGALANDINAATRTLRNGSELRRLLRTSTVIDGAAETASRNVLNTALTGLEQTIQDGGLGAGREAAGQALSRVRQAAQSGDLIGGIDDAVEALRGIRTPADNIAAQSAINTARAQLVQAADLLNPNYSAIRQGLDDFRQATREAGSFLRRSELDDSVRFQAEELNRALSSSDFLMQGQNLDPLQNWLRTADRLLEVADNLGLEGAGAASQAARELGDEIPALRKWGRAIGAGRTLSGMESQGAGIFAAMGRGTLGAGLGFLIGGPLGAGAGAALGTLQAAFTHPVGVARMMAAMETNIGRSTTRMAQGVERVRSSLLSPRLERAAQLGGRQVPRLVLALRDQETREQEYNEMVEQVRQYAGNPDLLLERVGNLSETVGSVSPDAGNAMAMSMVQGVNYLAQHLPPASQPGLFPNRQRRPSTAEMIDFVRRFEAIEDPLSILDRTADGTLTEAHVDAVRAVYPRIYQAVQGEITNILTSLEDTAAVPYSRRTRIGLLMGVPSDPSLDGRFIFAMQQAYSQTTEQNRVQGGRQGSFTMSAEVADDTMSRAASLTYRI